MVLKLDIVFLHTIGRDGIAFILNKVTAVIRKQTAVSMHSHLLMSLAQLPTVQFTVSTNPSLAFRVFDRLQQMPANKFTHEIAAHLFKKCFVIITPMQTNATILPQEKVLGLEAPAAIIDRLVVDMVSENIPHYSAVILQLACSLSNSEASAQVPFTSSKNYCCRLLWYILSAPINTSRILTASFEHAFSIISATDTGDAVFRHLILPALQAVESMPLSPITALSAYLHVTDNPLAVPTSEEFIRRFYGLLRLTVPLLGVRRQIWIFTRLWAVYRRARSPSILLLLTPSIASVVHLPSDSKLEACRDAVDILFCDAPTPGVPIDDVQGFTVESALFVTISTLLAGSDRSPPEDHSISQVGGG